tara:strand:+ start:380 stop:565 length:186 start_codon:yes stop_codon:yes gene_type:complete
LSVFLIIALVVSGIIAVFSFRYIPFKPQNKKQNQNNEIFPNRKKLGNENVKKLNSKEKSAP